MHEDPKDRNRGSCDICALSTGRFYPGRCGRVPSVGKKTWGLASPPRRLSLLLARSVWMKTAGFSKKQALKAKVGRGRFNPDLYQDTRQANTWTDSCVRLTWHPDRGANSRMPLRDPVALTACPSKAHGL